MEYDNELIKHTLKVFGFNLKDLDINKIQHVPMHQYRLSTIDKPQLYVENLQCCIGLFAYGNGFGFAAHINPVVMRNNEFSINENHEIICNRCNDLLNSLLSYKESITEPFKIGISLGVIPHDINDLNMQAIYNGTRKIRDKIKELNIPATFSVIEEPEFIIDTSTNIIITPKKYDYQYELSSCYANEIIISPDGIPCQVLNTDRINFIGAPIGRKKKETMVLKANGNEKIYTLNSSGLIESTYITKPGDAIFYNNEKDIYVPRDSNGNPRTFDDLENFGFEITCEPFKFGENNAVKVKSTNKAYLLPEIIETPTCIKDAWGKGAHQFLYRGATIKKEINTGKVTGIEKYAFDSTWEIVEQEKHI